jgi:hypothetical protein
MPKRATVLSTGGAGFIGSCYVHMVLRDHLDWTIRVLHVLTYAGTIANIAEIGVSDPSLTPRDLLGACNLQARPCLDHLDKHRSLQEPIVHACIEPRITVRMIPLRLLMVLQSTPSE